VPERRGGCRNGRPSENPGNYKRPMPFECWFQNTWEVHMGRGILLWLLGVPIPVIILLALLWR